MFLFFLLDEIELPWPRRSVNSPTVASISSEAFRGSIASIADGLLGDELGLKAGDRVVSVDGRPVIISSSIFSFMRKTEIRNA